MSLRRQRNRDDRGAAAVEFALVLIPLLLIVYGIIDFGRFYQAQSTFTQAARVGAREASLGTAVATVQSDATNAASLAGVTVTSVTDPDTCSTSNGVNVTVTVNGTFKFLLLPFSSFNVQGKATAPC